MDPFSQMKREYNAVLDDADSANRNKVNYNAWTTCTNSSGVKPDLGLDKDQQ